MPSMTDFVTDLRQGSKGVDIELGNGVDRKKIEAMAVKCAPGGPGCKSDCCEPEFRARIEGIEVSGSNTQMTMHLLGSVTVAAVSEKMSRCDCYDEE